VGFGRWEVKGGVVWRGCDGVGGGWGGNEVGGGG